MKCITYVSTIVAGQNGAMIPNGFSEIFRVARKNNAQHAITGVLSYRNGHYIQVIEGKDETVDQLFSNIQSDSRHDRVNVLLDVPIAELSFPSWEMKLLESTKRDALFSSFILKNIDSFNSLDRYKRRLLAIFYDLDNTSSHPEQSYDGKDLMLRAWPNFSKIKPSPVVIELCARLTKRRHSYKVLLESGEFGTQQQLDKILKKFETLEILVISNSTNQASRPSPSKSPTSFYSKMKHLLGVGRRHGL